MWPRVTRITRSSNFNFSNSSHSSRCHFADGLPAKFGQAPLGLANGNAKAADRVVFLRAVEGVANDGERRGAPYTTWIWGRASFERDIVLEA